LRCDFTGLGATNAIGYGEDEALAIVQEGVLI
jgi:hypothetical protein